MAIMVMQSPFTGEHHAALYCDNCLEVIDDANTSAAAWIPNDKVKSGPMEVRFFHMGCRSAEVRSANVRYFYGDWAYDLPTFFRDLAIWLEWAPVKREMWWERRRQKDAEERAARDAEADRIMREFRTAQAYKAASDKYGEVDEFYADEEAGDEAHEERSESQEEGS